MRSLSYNEIEGVNSRLADCYVQLGFRENSFPIAERYANDVLSLPMFNGMKCEEIDYVVECCNQYE